MWTSVNKTCAERANAIDEVRKRILKNSDQKSINNCPENKE